MASTLVGIQTRLISALLSVIDAGGVHSEGANRSLTVRMKSYPARRLRDLRSQWLRRNAKGLMLLFLGIVAVDVAVLLWLVWVGATPASMYLLGLTHAASLAVLWYLTNVCFLAHNHDAIWQLRGAW
ncbi:hypothetical protein [Pimelobacter simplex]|uniref:hypothetical protein n=1 Tax=Nocardioides simplex TaxID=2045 RepID=UPI00193456A9|nr:hypothetical protein [Pimelobacter simplex]